MWLLVLAFIYISSSDFKPQWIAQELDPSTFDQLLEQPIDVVPVHVSMKLSLLRTIVTLGEARKGS